MELDGVLEEVASHQVGPAEKLLLQIILGHFLVLLAEIGLHFGRLLGSLQSVEQVLHRVPTPQSDLLLLQKLFFGKTS